MPSDPQNSCGAGAGADEFCCPLAWFLRRAICAGAKKIYRFLQRWREKWDEARIRRLERLLTKIAGGAGPELDPIWYLDWPDVTKDNLDESRFRVKGWIASVRPVSDITFENPALAAALRLDFRPGADVEKIFNMPAVRFEGSCDSGIVKGQEIVVLSFKAGGRRHEIIVPVHWGRVDKAGQKARKLARIIPLLACPACRRAVSAQDERFVCGGCGAAYRRAAGYFDFLPPELAREADIKPTENVSANQYNGVSLNYVHSLKNGLILDCGAGLRNKYYENVVNLEIVPYESTDVLAVAEHIPFCDDAFDAVFSFAVLEHVKDPFAAAREMVRVLKPGGILFCQAPLLSPVHGYPHHYFNMTSAGLRALFEGMVEIERLEPLLFGQPVHCLSWFLNSYVRGLPPVIASYFMEKKVKDLLKPADAYLGAPFVTYLRQETREELACVNSLIARKR